MRRTACLALGILSALLAVPAAALAVEEGEAQEGNSLERAIEESGLRPPPPQRFSLPDGRLKVTPNALVAAHAGQRLHFTVSLSRAVEGATLRVRLPRRWVTVPASGIRAIRAPRLARGARHRARVRRSGRTVVLALGQTDAGKSASFDLVDVGIPAGTYRLRFSWLDQNGRRTRAGTATVRFYAPSREGPAGNPWARLSNPGQFKPVVSDSREESETFIAVQRGERDRVGLGSNWDQSSMPFWVSDNAGQSWTGPTSMPTTLDVKGSPIDQVGAEVCCDPMAAADNLGNIWFGGLTLDSGAGSSRIIVNRVAAGATNFGGKKTVALATGDDKPLMTIDNNPSSPTYGRLYVVWNHSVGSGIRIQISQCDSQPTPSNCDNADNWSTPQNVTSTIGSYIYADVGVGPDGKVYVTWWDFSNTNAIRGDVCDPSSANCAASTGWSNSPSIRTIAVLNGGSGTPVPFQCPILAQPGGRDAPEPQIAVDSSGGPSNGRVYVTWGDLRSGSGTTRCTDFQQGAATHLRWDSFVASASGALPGSSSPSSSVGTRLITDGEGAAGSDDWFPSITVDQSSGQAWAALYSTREDPTRRTAQHYSRSVSSSGGLGVLTKVSSAASNYSGPNDCDPFNGCEFLNDYGDYEGIAAAQGVAYPVWTDNSGSGGDGDPDTFVATPGPVATTGAPTAITATKATLHATINPGGSATTYRFRYGVSPGAQTSATAPASAGSGNSPVAVSANLSGLTPGRTYFVHVDAANANGRSNWTERAFGTTPTAPSVSTSPATGVGSQSATLRGTVNPNGRLTTRHFEFGKTTSYGSSTSTTSLGSGFSALATSATLGSLAPATTYHFRLAASNIVGPRFGADRTFTTSGVPDTTRPKARVRKVRCKRRRCTITIRATDVGSSVKSLRVRVKGTGRSRGRRRRVNKRLKSRKRRGGNYTAKIKLPRGRYTVRTFATDAAGNRSKTAKKKFRVR